MAGGQNLGEAVLKITLDTKTLKTQLDQLKKDIEGVQAGPVKLKPDGTSTRSRTTPADTAAKKAAADEARRVASLNALEARRFRIGRELNKLEERGVNISRLRSKLESNTLRRSSSQAEITSAREQTRSLERQVALRKDLADKEKRANAATKQAVVAPPPPPPKPPRLPDRGLDRTPLQGSVREVGSPAFGTRGARQGGQSESITAKTDAQSKRARLNQQLNSLEASGVKTTKLRAQLGEATTAQANRQFGTFNQIANKLSESLRAEREKLKIQRQQSNELKGQVTEEKRIGKLNASPVRGGIAFKGSPIAEEVAARKQQRLAKDLDAGAMERAANRRAKIENRIDYLSTGGRDQSVRSAATPLKPNAAAIKAEELLDKSRKATAATTEKEAKRIAKDNASPVGGRPGDKESPAFKAAEEKRTQERNARRAEKISARQDYLSTGGRDRSILTGTSAFARPDPQAVRAEQELQKARAKTAAQTLRTTTAENRKQERERAARGKETRERIGGTLSSGLIGGGFPLLFGQGAGAAAGGAVGGLAGGAIGGGFGFALSVVGTAIGAAFDEMLAKGKVLALGLDDPIAQFEALKEASLFSNLGVEKNVGALIKGGRTEEAKLIAQDDLTKRFGDTASLDAYIKSQDELNRAWAEASIAVAQFTSGPLAAFLADLAKGLGGGSENAERVRVNTGLQNLGPKGNEDFVKFARKRGVRLDDKGSLDNGLFGDPDNLRKGFEARKAFVQSRGFVDPEIKRQQEVEAQIRNARQQYLKQEQRRLKINALSISGNKLGAIDEQIDVVNEDRRSKIASLARTASPVEKENINRQADGEIAKLSAEKLKIQNDLNQALQSEAIIRRGIAQQITASVAQQGAALARGDSAANPGNKVLAARAGDADARAFLEQNRQGVNSARSAEAQLQNQIKFEVDPSKIAELQSKLATAAQATKLAMVEAGTALASKAADAAASLQGARDGMRGLLESNIDKLPGEAQVDLKRQALGDVQRGVQSGILRPNINFNNTKSLLENASFVRQVEAAKAQVAAAEAQINALNANTQALQQGSAINVTVVSDGAGGWDSGGAERVAA